MICIRCHAYPEFVIDTLDALKYYSVTNPYIMIAVDNNDYYNMVSKIISKHQNIGVYISKYQCGWGSGLYKLLVDSLKWARNNYKFKHFCVMDYDTLFIREGADQMLLDSIKENSGLLGAVQAPHVGWKHSIDKYRSTLNKYLNIPDTYIKAQGVLGALMLLTEKAISRFILGGWRRWK